MFTGLVQDKARVAAIERNGDGVRLTVETKVEPIARGDSVSINGVCLTAVETGGGRFTADVMEETLRRSSLAALSEGDAVNVEPALQASARLGGHIVQGHVDGLGEVADVREEGFARVVRVARSGRPAPLRRREGLDRGRRRLADRQRGRRRLVRGVADPRDARADDARRCCGRQSVNLEVDVVAKYVEKLVAR